ncbi:MAG: hypothetical protein ACR2LC_09080 [Pyrinomonadaceae bacterium]
MNCGKFETVLIDLARANVMDAALRADAAAHAENCAPCAARLTEERALTHYLRAFASASENIEAPPQIETALRAAFQKLAADTIITSHSPAPASTVSFFKAKTPRRRIVWTAVAAMLLVCFGLTAATRFFYAQRGTETATTSAISSGARLSAANAPDAQENGEASQTIAPSPDIAPVEIIKATQQTANARASNRADYLTVANATNKNGARRSNNHKERLNRNDSRADFTDETAAANRDEIATDFLPLGDANNLAAQDGGQLVRVELPRSALLTFGLPMNMERAAEPVKADVLVGQNGLARAIRFVR